MLVAENILIILRKFRQLKIVHHACTSAILYMGLISKS